MALIRGELALETSHPTGRWFVRTVMQNDGDILVRLATCRNDPPRPEEWPEIAEDVDAHIEMVSRRTGAMREQLDRFWRAARILVVTAWIALAGGPAAMVVHWGGPAAVPAELWGEIAWLLAGAWNVVAPWLVDGLRRRALPLALEPLALEKVLGRAICPPEAPQEH